VNIAELFLWPQAWIGLLAVPLLALGLGYADRCRQRRLAQVVGPRAAALAADLGTGRRRTRRALASTGLTFAVIAAMQPAWGWETRPIEQRGVDLIVCLDVSRSMLARDLPPDRLQYAQREMRALAEHVRGDRLGLVLFAGVARLAVPLTRDATSFAELVDHADPLSVARGGTDLGAALETALTALEGAGGEHEAVLLITDGEDLEQRGLRVAATCAERHIVVHCAGVGSALGSKITVRDGDRETFLRNANGDEVVSALDADSLRAIAERTGGTFVDVAGRPRALVDLYESQLGPLVQKSFTGDPRREPRNRFQLPLLAAFLCWLLRLGLGERKTVGR